MPWLLVISFFIGKEVVIYKIPVESKEICQQIITSKHNANIPTDINMSMWCDRERPDGRRKAA